ncbi:MAG: ATPase, T2SS/T4P/T4SS family [Candidatus Omnitrophota bacterium]
MEKDILNILVEEGLITSKQLDEIKGEQKLTNLTAQKILLSKGYISDEQLAKAQGKVMDVGYIKLSDIKIDAQVIQMVPMDVARRYNAVPAKMQGNDLYVAFINPADLPARNEIRLLTGCVIKPMITTEKEIVQAISKYYKVEDSGKQALIDMRVKELKDKKKEKASAQTQEQVDKLEDMPVVRLVNDIIAGAINAKASDIHLEPQDPEMRVRYRIDGILHDVMKVPKHIESAVISRIKIMSNLDITERRRPQDGHITIKKEAKDYDFRISTLLTINGEKVVIRILDRASMLISLERLGLTSYDQKIFRSLVDKPYGMVLVTGPTGSGKTTTLYAVLSQLNKNERNIITIENPVEYKLNGINQIQVDSGVNMTFATGLRTILRQDPDIIMVGEIRDKETAEIAIHAALTGHLVFSTLHTNDAPSAVTRLVDMGVEPFLISSTVIGAIAQRLCRVICPECKQEYSPSQDELNILEHKAQDTKLVHGKGCDFCYHTGFKGRSAIFEVMKISEAIAQLILDMRPVPEIKAQAMKEGMKTLRQNGIQKVLDKISTIAEVKRVVYTEENK